MDVNKRVIEKQSLPGIPCPDCSHKTDYMETIYQVPYFGKLLIASMSCEQCSWKTTQVYSLEQARAPVKYQAMVESVEDLETKVIRAPTATITIPELGIEITPTSYTDGYFNNLEGLLVLAEDASQTGRGKATRDFQQKLQQARDGKIKFTVVLDDPNGNSALVGKKVKKLR